MPKGFANAAPLIEPNITPSHFQKDAHIYIYTDISISIHVCMYIYWYLFIHGI